MAFLFVLNLCKAFNIIAIKVLSGCTGFDDIVVEVISNCFKPLEAIIPNSDGIYDLWIVSNRKVTAMRMCMFTTGIGLSCLNNGITKITGTVLTKVNASRCNYYYVIEIKIPGGRVSMIKGSLSI